MGSKLHQQHHHLVQCQWRWWQLVVHPKYHRPHWPRLSKPPVQRSLKNRNNLESESNVIEVTSLSPDSQILRKIHSNVNVHCPLSHVQLHLPSSKPLTYPAWGSPRRNWSVSSLLLNCWSPTARANANFKSASLKQPEWRNFRTVRSQTRTNQYQQNWGLDIFRRKKCVKYQRHAKKIANTRPQYVPMQNDIQ